MSVLGVANPTRLMGLLVLSLAMASWMGCGSGDGTTVILPGEDYQLNDQEQANLEEEARMRQQGGD